MQFLPIETLEAYKDHGDPENRLEIDLDGASAILAQLRHEEIDLARLTQQLEDEGIEKFNAPYEKLLNAIEKQKQLA
ncbi:transaldolase family protein [Pedobacter sp. NJ-S-72]